MCRVEGSTERGRILNSNPDPSKVFAYTFRCIQCREVRHEIPAGFVNSYEVCTLCVDGLDPLYFD